jgi:hypothetical protein
MLSYSILSSFLKGGGPLAVEDFLSEMYKNPQSFGQPLPIKGHRKTVLFIL